MATKQIAPGLPKPLYEAIGRVAVSWTELTRIADQAIEELLRLKEPRIVTQHLADTVKFPMLQALTIELVFSDPKYRGRGQERGAKIKVLMHRIDSLRVKRNNVIHGEYNRDLTRHRTHAVRYKWTARGELRVKAETVTSIDTNRVANEIQVATADLWHYYTELGVWKAAIRRWKERARSIQRAQRRKAV